MSSHNFDATVKALDDGDGNEDGFEVVLSTSSIDRQGERIAPFAMAPLPEHITFDVDHEMRVSGTVGSGRPEYRDDGNTLAVRGRWASTNLAQMVRSLVREGHIRTTSVAVRIHPNGATEADDGVWTIKSGELLNGAFVAIPANPEAVVLAAKSLTGSEHDAAAGETSGAAQETVPDDAETRQVDVSDEAVSEDDAAADSADDAAEAAESTVEATAEADEMPVDLEALTARASALAFAAEQAADNDEYPEGRS